MNITYDQLQSIVKVIKHQGSDSLEKMYTSGLCVMIQFKHITIGIEPDGHSHS